MAPKIYKRTKPPVKVEGNLGKNSSSDISPLPSLALGSVRVRARPPSAALPTPRVTIWRPDPLSTESTLPSAIRSANVRFIWVLPSSPSFPRRVPDTAALFVREGAAVLLTAAAARPGSDGGTLYCCPVRWCGLQQERFRSFMYLWPTYYT